MEVEFAFLLAVKKGVYIGHQMRVTLLLATGGC